MKNRALLLDRDGVVNVDRNYVSRIEEFEFMPGIFELCATAQALGFLPIVITNQAGIGRGYYTEDDFRTLSTWMVGEFANRGIRIARIYHCPYHPTEGVGEYRRESFDRKPNPGMILRASADFGLDLSRSVLIGDKESDLAAGTSAGIGCNVKLSVDSASHSTSSGLEFRSLPEITRWFQSTHGQLNCMGPANAHGSAP